MDGKVKDRNKNTTQRELLYNYLREMDELVHRYPEDPNQIDITEAELNKMIKDQDKNWAAFERKWREKLAFTEERVFSAKVKKGSKNIRHLIIKSEVSGKDVLDLTIPDKD